MSDLTDLQDDLFGNLINNRIEVVTREYLLDLPLDIPVRCEIHHQPDLILNDVN